ncbi:hypothetical protein CLOM_g14244 [Closterium sp. NIES-68]|nr:hypothetical protein CLOM_g14244 [Closterium sp. NIES-68]
MSQVSSRRWLFLEDRPSRRLPPDSSLRQRLPQERVSYSLRELRIHCNAVRVNECPSTFQLTMNEIFRDLLDKCVIIYLDDILLQNRLITKGSTCEFLKPKLEFLGHVISTEGVKIDPRKIRAIQEWKPPTNLHELQSFLGFVNYVRRFIPNMAGLIGALANLFHKGTDYQWGEKQQAAF